MVKAASVKIAFPIFRFTQLESAVILICQVGRLLALTCSCVHLLSSEASPE